MKDQRIQNGKIMAAQRKALGMTQKDASLKSDIHRTVISQIEQGKFTGSLATIERYLLLLGMQWSVSLLPSGYSQLGDDDGLFNEQG